MSTLVNNFTYPSPLLFRNYDVTGSGYTFFGESHVYLLPGISDCKVIQAARATSAAPTFFKPLVMTAPKPLRRKMVLFQLILYNLILL